MAIMSICYIGGMGAWIFMSTGITSFKSLRMSFYGTAGIAIASIMSTWCYYRSLSKIKKERLVKKLINDTD